MPGSRPFIKFLATPLLSLPDGDIDIAQIVLLKKLLADNIDVFVLNNDKLGCTDLVQHVIKMGSHFRI